LIVSQPEFVADFETDPRFPSGKWVGFYLMPHTKATRHQTELVLNFRNNRMWGEGRDKVGKFIIEGKYNLVDGRCHWLKTYIAQHSVDYDGYNEGKGIWGIWEIPNSLGIQWRGGFHIWPIGISDPSQPALREQADTPVEVEDPALVPV
jgi:hypothetical protein